MKIRNVMKIIQQRNTYLGLISNHLRFSDTLGGGFWGSLTEEEESALTAVVKDFANGKGSIIEFGTLFGTTTLSIAESKTDKQRLITIDNYSWNPFMMSSEDHEKFTKRCLRAVVRNSDVELLNIDADEFKLNWNGPTPELVFLDADHRYDAVISDIKWAIKVKSKIVSGHDFSAEWPGVQRAVVECFGSNFETAGTFWWAWSANSLMFSDD